MRSEKLFLICFFKPFAEYLARGFLLPQIPIGEKQKGGGLIGKITIRKMIGSHELKLLSKGDENKWMTVIRKTKI